MAEIVARLRKEGEVLFVDAGNAFFSAPVINPNRVGLEKLRAELIARSYQRMKLDFLTPGQRDLALGPEVFFDLAKITGAKIVSANLEVPGGVETLSKYEKWEGKGSKIIITALNLFEKKLPDGFRVINSEEALEKVIEISKKEAADRVIVLSHLGQTEDKKIGDKFPGLFIVGAASLDFTPQPVAAGQSFLFEPGIEGQRLGLVELSRQAPGFSQARLVDMTEEYDVSNPVKKLMEDYYEALKKNSAQYAVQTRESKSWVSQPRLCKECHEEQYLFWKGTKHSSAILSLYAKNQHYNPSCVECHTNESETWLKKTTEKNTENLLREVFRGDKKAALNSRREPERYKKLHLRYWKAVDRQEQKKELEKNLMGVQCEHCHGSRVEHVQGLRNKPQRVNEETCKTCHRPPNAPEFEKTMLEKVSCPLIAKKEAEKK